MTDIVKEAIAEAKQLREGAIENAKAMLQEQFMPKIEKMIEQQLSEEDDEDEVEIEEAVESNEDDDMELETILRELEEDDDEEDLQEKRKRKKPVVEPEDGEELTESEIDEMLAEMEDEEELTESEIDEMLAEMEEDEEDLQEKRKRKKPVVEPKNNEMEDDDELTESDIRSLVDEILEEDDEDTDEEDDEDFDFPDDLDIDLDSDGESDVNCKCAEVEAEAYRLSKENKKLKSDLKESYDAIKLMKDKINEVNLMNSKLLYTNKLFNNESLNLSSKQKMSILETFDKANTLNEVKLIYSTFTSKLTANESKETKKSLRGFASDTVITENRKAEPEIDSMVSRWQALAGMKSPY